MTTDFDALHPRGADGRFIHKLGLIKFLLDGKWLYGKVSDISATPNGKVTIEAQESDLFGKPTGVTHALTPKQVYSAPKPIASLKVSDPEAKKVGGQAGSNPGGFYELKDPATGDTHKWYVKKAKSKEHGRNEALANALYRALGASVPDVYFDETDGNIYSRVVPGSVEDMNSQLNNPEWMTLLQSNFVLDAWLANWDVFGMTYDNVKTADGVPYRIDNGGALLYRAQGAAKGTQFGPTVPELTSFKTGKKAKVYGSIPLELEFDGAARVVAMTPGDIAEMVDTHNLPLSLAETLIARRAEIAKHYGLPLPESVEDAPELDIADITEAGKKGREWKSMPLWAADAILKSGDVVQFPDGTEGIYGEDPALPGIPLSTAAKKIQMAGWLSKGADTEVWVKDLSTDFDAPRPGYGEVLTPDQMLAYRWERGDQIHSSSVGVNDVLGVNPKTGVIVLRHATTGEITLWSSRDTEAGLDMEVYPWDGNLPQKEGTVDLPPGVEEWEYALIAPPQEPEVISYPADAQPEGAPELNLPDEQMTYVDATTEVLAPPEPVDMAEEAKVPGQAKAIADQMKSELAEIKQTKASSKGTVLADGTEASPGDTIWSAKDAKSYLYVKKKGPYAVVTDPDSDTPEKQLLKLASVLTSSKESKPIETTAAKPLPSANGVIPKLGDQAVAKDGWTGEIVMISPDGKFVFIEDLSGKRKRKSAGTVTITSSVEPDAPEVEIITSEETGITTVSVPTSPLKYGVVGDADNVLPKPMDVPPTDENEKGWYGVVYADGTFGLEPEEGVLGKLPDEALIQSSGGGAGAFSPYSWAPISTMVLAEKAKKDWSDGKEVRYEVIYKGKEWRVLPGDSSSTGGLVLSDGDETILLSTVNNENLPAMITFRLRTGGMKTYSMEPVESLPKHTPLPPADGSFVSLSKAVNDGLAVNDWISLNGTGWVQVTAVLTEVVYAKDPNTGEEHNFWINDGSGTTLVVDKASVIMETVDIGAPGPKNAQLMESLTAEVAGTKAKVVELSQDTVTADDWVSLIHENPDAEFIVGKVVDVMPSAIDPGMTQLYIQTDNSGTLSYAAVPNGWPVINHGGLYAGQPVPVTLSAYIDTIGVTPGDHVFMDGVAHKVVGVNWLGDLEMEGNITISNVAYKGNDIVQITKGVPAPEYPVWTPGETATDVTPEPELVTLVDDSLLNEVHQLWDSEKLGVPHPVNSTIYYDSLANSAIWMGGDGEMKHIKVSATDGIVQSTPVDEATWAAKVGQMTVLSKPKPQTFTVGTFDFQTIPDHSLVQEQQTGDIWQVPAGKMNDTDAWLFVSGQGNLVPGIATDVNISDTTVLLDVNETVTPNATVVKTQDKPPTGWPEEGIPGHPIPGSDYAVFPDIYGDLLVLVADDAGIWHRLETDGSVGSTDMSLTHLNALANSFNSPEATLWTPKGGDAISVHGVSLPVDTYVMKKEGSNHVYVKTSPETDWEVLYSDGTFAKLSGPDLTIWGDPNGEQIWPIDPTVPDPTPVDDPELTTGDGPVPAGILGGPSLAYAGIPTEKDPLVESADVTLLEGETWLKANHPGLGSNAYYHVSADGKTISTFSVSEDADGQKALGWYSKAQVSSVEELMDLMKPYVFTEVTPGAYHVNEEPPAWEDLVSKTLNPGGLGFNGLPWKNPQEIIDAAEDEYTKEWMTDAIGWVPTHFGEGHKTIMVQFPDPEGSGETKQGFFAVFANGKVGPIDHVASMVVKDKKLSGWPNGEDLHDEPVGQLFDVLDDSIGGDFELYDVSSTEPPWNWITGWKASGKKTPENQWALPVAADTEVFRLGVSDMSTPSTHAMRQADGKWYEVSLSGAVMLLAKDDKEMSDYLLKSKKKLTHKPKPTDSPTPNPAAANVPKPVDTNIAKVDTIFMPSTGGKIDVPAGAALYKQDDENEPVKIWAIKAADGTWKYTTEDIVAEGGDVTWFQWHAPYGIDTTYSLKPVPLASTVPVGTPGKPSPHPSYLTAPSGADPSVLNVPGKAPDEVNYADLPVGQWFAEVSVPGASPIWHEVVLDDMGVKVSQPHTYDETDKKWLPASWGQTPLFGGLYSGKVHVVEPMGKPVDAADPSAPPAPKYPGELPPSAGDVASWGGSLTKDGHIPTSGMYVKGKGPMNGMILSVSKDKTKAVVLTSDGKKTTRLLAALSVDHVGSKKALGPVALPGIPGDMPLSIDPPDVAVQKVLADGKPRGILAGPGTKDGTVVLYRAKTADGQMVVRAYFRMRKDDQGNLISGLQTTTGEKGGWDATMQQSEMVAVGDRIAMRWSSQNKWKPDGSGTTPTHTVTKVGQPDADGVREITLTHLQSGDTVTSRFHSGPERKVNLFHWNPDKPPPPPTSGAVNLSAAAKADGWETLSGHSVSTVKGGVLMPSSYALQNHYGSTGKTLVHRGADGTVIESVVGKQATGGFTAITVKVTDGVDPAQSVLAAMEKMGVKATPPTQSELRRLALVQLSTLLSYNASDLDGTSGADPNNLNDPKTLAMFKQFSELSGVPDVGWQDVLVGQDSRGFTTFYWSDRVQEGLVKKNSGNVILRAATNGSGDVAVSTLLSGTMPGALRVAEGFSSGASGSSDNNHMAAYGGFFSKQSKTHLPTSNGLASYKSSNMMVYYNPRTVLRRLQDYRVSVSNDAFGQPSPGTNSAKAALSASARDFYIDGGLSGDDIGYIALASSAEVQKAIKELKARGITHIGGRPVESIIITQSAAGSLKPSSLPTPDLPDNVRPILDIPESYEEATSVSPAA